MMLVMIEAVAHHIDQDATVKLIDPTGRAHGYVLHTHTRTFFQSPMHAFLNVYLCAQHVSKFHTCTHTHAVWTRTSACVQQVVFQTCTAHAQPSTLFTSLYSYEDACVHAARHTDSTTHAHIEPCTQFSHVCIRTFMPNMNHTFTLTRALERTQRVV